jgi:hypothetical protein
MKKFFITYGNNYFIRSRERIKQEALALDLFDSIAAYAPQHISKTFLQHTKPYIQTKKGYFL